jgi:hypothetical protein
MTPGRSLSPYRIGEPGRAALEVLAGPPGRHPAGPDVTTDIAASAATVAGAQIRAATVRGVTNRAQGRPRQDAFALGRRPASGTGSKDDGVIAVACGGVVGPGRSEEAALLASQHLAGLAAAWVPWPDAFVTANTAISAHLAATLLAGGRADEADAGGMATDAVGLVVRRDGGDWTGEAAWAGGCSLWHLSEAGRWTLLSDDKDAPPPLPSAHGDCGRRDVRITGGALFLMTRGVANPLAWSEQVRSTLADWWSSPPDPFTFAAQAGFARKSHLDDRTVIGIWPDQP